MNHTFLPEADTQIYNYSVRFNTTLYFSEFIFPPNIRLSLSLSLSVFACSTPQNPKETKKEKKE
jgi:hypothetical protein